MRRIPALSLSMLFLAAIAQFPWLSFEAQGQAPSDASLKFNKLDTMIPMRDGVRLHTEIYTPK
ncbi:MAG: hypothetical protein WA734_03705, partial [Candidatus Acidiferrales bacterium]